MKLFVAFDFPDEVKDAIEMSITSDMKSLFTGARWSKKEKYHVTLVFLGDVPESIVPDIKSAMDSCSDYAPMLLQIGTFDRFVKNGILFRGISVDNEVKQFRTRLISVLMEKGLDLGKEAKSKEGTESSGETVLSWTPHLTIARNARLTEEQELTFTSLSPPQDVSFTATEFTLMLSEEACYVPLHRTAFSTSSSSS